MIEYLILLGYMIFFFILVLIDLNDDGDYTGGIY